MRLMCGSCRCCAGGPCCASRMSFPKPVASDPVASTIRLDQSFIPSLHFPAPSSAAPPALPVRFLACSPLAFILCSSFPRGCITLPYSMAGMLLPPASQRDTFCRLANSNSEVKNGYRVVQKKRPRTQNTSPQVTPPLLPRHQCCWARSSAPDVAKKTPAISEVVSFPSDFPTLRVG